jgi:hypothetical protein
MRAKPNVSTEQLARLRAEDEQLRPMLESEMPTVREEWRQYVRSLTGVVSRHSKEIDEYIQNHGPMTRSEVIERALTKLLSEIWHRLCPENQPHGASPGLCEENRG